MNKKVIRIIAGVLVGLMILTLLPLAILGV